MTQIETPPLLVWSKSQVATYKECERKGFFSYSDGAENNNPELRHLKKIKNRYLWSGAFIHETIGQLIKKVSQGETPAPIDAILDELRNKMREEFRLSQLTETKEGRLFEHEYKSSVSKEEWQNQWTKVEQSLRWFSSSKWYSRLRELPPESWKVVDDVLSFDVSGIKTFVKIDCGLEVDGQFFLLDWKTSSIKATDEQSMRIAALYAHDVWGAELEQIQPWLVSLKDGKSIRVSVTEEHLMDITLQIQEEAELLQSKKMSMGETFESLPKTTNQISCTRCNFQKLCHPLGVGL